MVWIEVVLSEVQFVEVREVRDYTKLSCQCALNEGCERG